MKDIFVEELLAHEGLKISDQVFLLEDREVRQTVNGDPYLKMKLRDKSGWIDAIKWNVDPHTSSCLQRDDFVQVTGITRFRNGQPQLNVSQIDPFIGKVDPCDFSPATSQNIPQMQSELLELVKSVQNPYLSKLLNSFFGNSVFFTGFSETPGAVKIHHAYVGGLLEHTLSVSKMCVGISTHYSSVHIDRDLLLTGALLHDVGKMQEYGTPPIFARTDAGLFAGHISLGILMVDQAIQKIENFPELLRISLLHLLLSHHGTREYGSPVEPASIEAFILHFMDDLDAKVNNIWEWINRKETPYSPDSLWTDRCFPLDRLIFRGIPDSIYSDNDGNGKSSH